MKHLAINYGNKGVLRLEILSYIYSKALRFRKGSRCRAIKITVQLSYYVSCLHI